MRGMLVVAGFAIGVAAWALHRASQAERERQQEARRRRCAEVRIAEAEAAFGTDIASFTQTRREQTAFRRRHNAEVQARKANMTPAERKRRKRIEDEINVEALLDDVDLGDEYDE